MPPGQHHICSLAGQWQLVLDDHLDLRQPGVGQVPSERREAARPGQSLPGAGAGAAHPNVLANPIGKGAVLGKA